MYIKVWHSNVSRLVGMCACQVAVHTVQSCFADCVSLLASSMLSASDSLSRSLHELDKCHNVTMQKTCMDRGLPVVGIALVVTVRDAERTDRKACLEKKAHSGSTGAD